MKEIYKCRKGNALLRVLRYSKIISNDDLDLSIRNLESTTLPVLTACLTQYKVGGSLQRVMVQHLGTIKIHLPNMDITIAK